MQYLYNIEAGAKLLKIENEDYRYLFKVRREKKGSIIELRNLKDNILYHYKIIEVSKKDAILELIFAEEKEVMPKKSLTLGWCIIDPKVIEKSLPMLNEIGVTKIVFIKCAYSQSNFKIKKDKLLKILINSSQQCGRSRLMDIVFASSIYEFLQNYPQSYLLDFSDNYYSSSLEIDSIVIGCEGGISKDERELFENSKIIGLNSPLILRSQTAAIAISSKILL